MTDDEFNAWLTSPDAIRCLLVEATTLSEGAETIRYLSNTGFVSQSSDTPPSMPYLPIVTGGIRFTQNLQLDSSGLSYGDVELNNAEGTFDAWLDDIWVNRPIKMYTGDVRWARNDFRMVFNGVIADLDSKNRARLNIKLRDKLERLNSPVTEAKLEGTTQNKDNLLPVVFGEVHNITPLLIDPALHTYRVHRFSCRQVIEVRDNGAPVLVYADPANGTFTLSGTPAGNITASVQGDNAFVYGSNAYGWNVTVASIIRRLATGFGKEADRLTDDDIDLDNFDAFDAENGQAVGVWAGDKVNVLEVCQQLAGSIGAQLIASQLGKLQLVKLKFPGDGADDPVRIGPSDMLAQNIAIASRSEVKAAVKLGYCKNWTVQEALQTLIPEEHKNRFAREWDTTTARYTTVAQQYGLQIEPEQRDTLLLNVRSAEPEAWRLLDILSVPRTTYRFDGLPRMLLLKLGQAVLLQHPRFGLEDGKPGVVVGLTPDWVTGRVTVEVMV